MGAMPESELTTDTMPRHRVDIGAFEMSAVLITQGLWRYLTGNNPSTQVGSKKPVHQISWWDAIQFCNVFSETLGLEPAYTIVNGTVDWNRDAKGFRLPTEAEWEYAARTRDDLRYSGGNDISKLGWTAESEVEEMPDVGMKEPNLWGFHDLSGLVFEWCWDEHKPYTTHKQQSEEASDAQSLKVCRGGSWKHEAKWACVQRDSLILQNFKGMVGLRLTRTL